MDAVTLGRAFAIGFAHDVHRKDDETALDRDMVPLGGGAENASGLDERIDQLLVGIFKRR